MVRYNSRTGRTEYTIGPEKLAAPATAPAQMPPVDIQRKIALMAQKPGYGVERIFAVIRRKHHGITKDAIRFIVARYQDRESW